MQSDKQYKEFEAELKKNFFLVPRGRAMFFIGGFTVFAILVFGGSWATAYTALTSGIVEKAEEAAKNAERAAVVASENAEAASKNAESAANKILELGGDGVLSDGDEVYLEVYGHKMNLLSANHWVNDNVPVRLGPGKGEGATFTVKKSPATNTTR